MSKSESSTNSARSLPRYRVLGVPITCLTPEQWLDVVQTGIANNSQRILVSQNLHSAYLAPRREALAEMQRMADVVRIDGMPLVWIANLLGLPVRRDHRAGFMDLMPLLMARAASYRWKIFVIAGRPGVAETAARILRDQYEGLSIEVEDGYFTLDDSDGEVTRRLSRLQSAKADILLMGMGMPRQEEFLLRYAKEIPVPIIGTCGAAFDYVANEIPMAPRWLSKVGMEWLFRLIAEPRRLWRRYLLEPATLIPRLARDLSAKWSGKTDFTDQQGRPR